MISLKSWVHRCQQHKTRLFWKLIFCPLARIYDFAFCVFASWLSGSFCFFLPSGWRQKSCFLISGWRQKRGLLNISVTVSQHLRPNRASCSMPDSLTHTSALVIRASCVCCPQRSEHFGSCGSSCGCITLPFLNRPLDLKVHLLHPES